MLPFPMVAVKGALAVGADTDEVRVPWPIDDGDDVACPLRYVVGEFLRVLVGCQLHMITAKPCEAVDDGYSVGERCGVSQHFADTW